MLSIELQGVKKSFGAFTAIESVDLSVKAGQTCVLIGPSGAGKTTLLRIIAGLEKCDQGEVLIDGTKADNLRAADRGVAYLTQDYALYPQLSVKKNLEVSLRSLKLSRHEQDHRISDIVGWFRIAEVLDRTPAQLSGGQAQRVAIAKALARQPKILLLDEPLSQLDSSLREELRLLLMQLADEFSMTLVMVTHDPIDAMSLADQIGVLEHGRVVQSGTPETVYRSPASKSAAQLLSPWGINWLPKEPLAKSHSEWFQRQSAELMNATTVIGFRPEDAVLVDAISIDNHQGSAGDLLLPISMKGTRYLGFSSLVVAEWEAHVVRCVVPTEKVSSSRSLPSTMLLRVRKECLLFFR